MPERKRKSRASKYILIGAVGAAVIGGAYFATANARVSGPTLSIAASKTSGASPLSLVVTGQYKDGGNQPISGGKIYLFVDKVLYLSNVTDASGMYNFQVIIISPGSHSIFASDMPNGT